MAITTSILAEGGSVVRSTNVLAQLHPFMYTHPGHATLNRHVSCMVCYCGFARLYAAVCACHGLGAMTYVLEAAYVAHEAAVWNTVLPHKASAVVGLCMALACLVLIHEIVY